MLNIQVCLSYANLFKLFNLSTDWPSEIVREMLELFGRSARERTFRWQMFSAIQQLLMVQSTRCAANKRRVIKQAG